MKYVSLINTLFLIICLGIRLVSIDLGILIITVKKILLREGISPDKHVRIENCK